MTQPTPDDPRSGGPAGPQTGPGWYGPPGGWPPPPWHPAWSMTPPPAAPPAPAPAPAPAPVVRVALPPQRGGFWRGVGLLLTTGCVAAVLLAIGVLVGVVALGGIAAWVAGSQEVVWQPWRDGGPGKIAVIPVKGVIDDGRAAFVRAAVRDVLDDGQVRAVVLRVDSPGGGVTPSDEIWREVERLKERGLPVIASMGGVAASGGYYVACGADHVLAQETTVTGSIGVIAQVMTFRGLMEKVGIEPVTLVATGSPEKDVANDLFREWNEADRAAVRVMIDAAYDVFADRVREGRRATIGEEELAEIANGSVFTAPEALEFGLVDEIGYLDDAIARAESRAGIGAGRAAVWVLGDPPAIFGPPRVGLRSMPTDAESLRSTVNDLASVRMMYLMR